MLQKVVNVLLISFQGVAPIVPGYSRPGLHPLARQVTLACCSLPADVLLVCLSRIHLGEK